MLRFGRIRTCDKIGKKVSKSPAATRSHDAELTVAEVRWGQTQAINDYHRFFLPEPVLEPDVVAPGGPRIERRRIPSNAECKRSNRCKMAKQRPFHTRSNYDHNPSFKRPSDSTRDDAPVRLGLIACLTHALTAQVAFLCSTFAVYME